MQSLTERKLWAYENFDVWLVTLHKTFSVRMIAYRAGISHSTVARLLSKKTESPSLATAIALIVAFVR